MEREAGDTRYTPPVLDPAVAEAAAAPFPFATHPAAPTEILRTLVGSRAYGLEHAGSDVDVRGVYVLPTYAFLGLARASDRATLPETLKLPPAEGDALWYELGHFVRLAEESNPMVMELLFAGPAQLLSTTPLGEGLRALRRATLSRRAATAYTGFATGQNLRVKLTGPRPTDYDLKAAAHLIRVCVAATALLRTGEFTLSVPERLLPELRAILAGERPYGIVRERIDVLLAALADAASTCVLPERPDHAALEAFVQEARAVFYR